MANHKLWTAVLAERLHRGTCLGGVIVTGWSRYDHFGILCELLPAALPSLALSLFTLASGAFNELAHRRASTAVGWSDGARLMPIVQRPR